MFHLCCRTIVTLHMSGVDMVCSSVRDTTADDVVVVDLLLQDDNVLSISDKQRKRRL